MRPARWIDDHHELLVKNYVLLKLDNFNDTHRSEFGVRVTTTRRQLTDAGIATLIDSLN